MQDRIVEFPNRYRLVKVSGTTDTYDLVPVPGKVTQEGTVIGKSTLLSDDTAALFGFGKEATPDSVLNTLGRFESGLADEYIWAKYADGQVPYIKEAANATTLTFNYAEGNQPQVLASRAVAIEGDKVVLVDPVTVSLGALPTRYYKHTDGIVYRIDSGTSGSVTHSSFRAFALSVDYAPGVVGYVNSRNPSAYPPAVSDGFDYVGPWQLGDRAGMIVGTYTGNAETDGATQTIRLGVTPKAVLVAQNGRDFDTNGYSYRGGFAVTGFPSGSASAANITIVDGGFTVLYSTAANSNVNALNGKYSYVAWY